MGRGVRPHRPRAERGDEALHELDALGGGRLGRGQEPRCRVEEVGRRARRAARGAAGDGMARDEARVAERGERPLRRGDVGDDDVRTGRLQHLLHDGRSLADRNRDDDELGVRDRLRERLRWLERAACGRALEHAGVGVEAATARPRAACGQRDGRPHEPRAHDGEALDRPRPLGHSRRRRRCRPVGRDLLLQHVEHRREDGGDAALRQRPGVRRDERLQQLRLALGVDPALAGRVLVVADGGDELEPPVQQLEQPPVELGDLGPECVELAHAAYRSPASTATCSRFAGGASGQTQPGS